MSRDGLYLRHILDAVTKIDTYIQGLPRDSFAEQGMVFDAVVRELEIIGEAARHVSVEYQRAHPEIPFGDKIGMRNRLIHEYFGVDVDVVWKTCTENLKGLKEQLAAMPETARTAA